jgi:hypothetical protein
MSSAVARMHTYQARRQAGLRVYSIELPEIDLVEELKANGFRFDEDDHHSVEQALQKAVEYLIFGKKADDDDDPIS